MSEKNPLPVARGRAPALLLLVVASLVALPLLLPSATLATEILIFALAALACNLLLGRLPMWWARTREAFTCGVVLHRGKPRP